MFAPSFLRRPPSGLENDGDLQALTEFASMMARGDVPQAKEVLKLGRMSALQKPDGGVRGIVVGDTFRQVVARTIAQQVAEAAEEATAPFQYALRTRAGTECVSHIRSLTDLDPRTTILSVDGVGAFDLISRNSMMEWLFHMEGGEKLLPFVRMFTALHPHSCGKTRRAQCTTSHRVKVASRATP